MRRLFTIWIEYDQTPEEIAANENVTRWSLVEVVEKAKQLAHYFPGLTVEYDDMRAFEPARMPASQP